MKDKFINDVLNLEKKDFFTKRTNFHINDVISFLDSIERCPELSFLDRDILEQEKYDHDSSKWEEPEYTPYVHITWDYKCKDEGIVYEVSNEIKNKMNEASNHHVKNNKHHPEYWSKTDINVINRDDRDKAPSEIIDATSMPPEYIASMCADWVAMSKEKNNSPYEWAKKNINIRWKFTKNQENLIYKIFDLIWK